MVCPGPVFAGQRVLEYRIEHPTYGEIGTYTNTVEQVGGSTKVETKLHVAVKILGVVVYREEAERTEHWVNDKLTLFRGITNANGDKVEVSGEARDGGFVISSPSGTFVAPANVHPSNPWSANILSSDVVMSTKTGKVFQARVHDDGEETVTLDGFSKRLRQFEIDSDNRQFVWLDGSGLPVAFRSEESGTPVDFILIKPPASETELSSTLQ